MKPNWQERWSRWLAERSTPAFGQLVIWILLIAGLTMLVQSYEMKAGPRQGPSTVFSWLPPEILAASAPFFLFRLLLIAGTIGWVLHRGLPWTPWLTVSGFIGLWSMHIENTWAGAHIFHASAMLLVLHALWVTFYFREIQSAVRAHNFWRSALYPRWVFVAGLVYLGLFHTYAGLAKFAFSGLDWANGESLQLWAHMDGYRWSPATQLLLNSRTAAMLLQWLTLVAETGAVLAVPFRWPRILFGLLLVGFYCGVMLTFPYGFAFNLVLTALYFLPVEEWLRRRYPVDDAILPQAVVTLGTSAHRTPAA